MCVGGGGGSYTVKEFVTHGKWMTFPSEEDYLLYREVEDMKQNMPPEALEGRSEAQIKRLAPSFAKYIKRCPAFRMMLPT